MHYYNALTYSYHHRIEGKNANSLGYALQTYLEFEEQFTRTRRHVEDYVKQIDMSTVLQLVQDISNRIIDFERKGMTSNSAKTSTWVALRNQTHSFQPKAILSRTWCNSVRKIMMKTLVILKIIQENVSLEKHPIQ